MKTNNFAKRFIPLIIIIVFGLILFMAVVGLELNMHYRIYELETISSLDILRILSDAFFVPSVFLIGTALIGFCKYVSLISVLYSAFQSLWELITLGFVPRSSRKAYRAYRKAARENSGSGLAVIFVTGVVFLTLAIIFLMIYYQV